MQGRAPVERAGFRCDINALRALAVIAVLGYHLRIPGFAGGFVGVDAFFVITGYLMTGKVVADLAAGRFSYGDFAMMRLRRIYPALLVVVATTAAAGWFLTLPGEYFRHVRQACYAIFFLSNFAFDNDNGYFAMAAQTKPLLHTWSLAVEWQFYIWMPLVVRFVWSRSPRSKAPASIMATLSAVAVVSFAWCLWQNQHDEMGSAFFSLRARAWEPLAGGMIAIAEVWCQASGRAPRSEAFSSTAARIGWILTAFCVAYPLPEARWPGALTLLPIVGAALVVAGGLETSRLVQSSVVQRIGDWSYSIYLWHWPIWVLAGGWLTARGYEVGAVSKAAMAAASIAVGAVAYYVVEQPFRLRRDTWTPQRLLAGTGAAAACFVAFTIGSLVTTGYPGRLPAYLLPAEMARKTDTPRDECFRNANSKKAASERYCTFGVGNADHATVMLWGDSFANQYLEPITTAATRLGLTGLIATQSACRPFADHPDRNAADSQPCRQFNTETLQYLGDRAEPTIIVLAGNWSNAIEIAPLVDTLLSNGKTVIIVMPLLNIGFDVPQKWIESQIRAGKAITEWKVAADPTLTMRDLRQKIDRTVLSPRKGNPWLISIDPQAEVCDDSSCHLVRSGQANFRDTAHISNVNAQQYEHLFETALGSAVHAGVHAER
ncbi:acyltransferase family protein [Bradyrhizobium sp. B124]|uniref:acyltransferase family protein n=1 Tax=Bradyrhizobium sp. B124 TaxID=3140245 RepID=UPI003182C9B3